MNTIIPQNTKSERLAEAQIFSWLKEQDTHYDFHIVSHTTSTMDDIATCPVSQDEKQVTVCLAEQQSAGRGLSGRPWHSPFAENIYCSSAWYFPPSANPLSSLSLVSALAILAALQQYGIGSALAVKWPNDVFYQGAKLAGILLQQRAMTAGSQVIISFGVNVNSDPQSTQANISQAWTSLKAIQGGEHNRNHIIALILNQLQLYRDTFQTRGWEAFIPQWTRYDYLYGQEVTLYTTHREAAIVGTVVGIDRSGRLLLQDAAQRVRAYSAGEVRLGKR